VDAQNRSGWRSTCWAAVAEFEAARVEALQDKRARRIQAVRTGAWACPSCPRICSSRIGLDCPYEDPSEMKQSVGYDSAVHVLCSFVTTTELPRSYDYISPESRPSYITPKHNTRWTPGFQQRALIAFSQYSVQIARLSLFTDESSDIWCQIKKTTAIFGCVFYFKYLCIIIIIIICY